MREWADYFQKFTHSVTVIIMGTGAHFSLSPFESKPALARPARRWFRWHQIVPYTFIFDIHAI